LNYPPVYQLLPSRFRLENPLAQRLLFSSSNTLLMSGREEEMIERLRRCAVNRDPDAALVAATKRGDSHAFEELVLRYERRVFAAAQRITKNREDAEDVVQDTFHKAFLHLDGFQEKSLLSTWLTRIAINQGLMLLRRRRGALEVFPESCDDDAESISAAFADQSPNPEESCWRRECADLLTNAINRLHPAMRRTILLRDIGEHSLEETAQILNMSIPAVKSRVFRGRRELSGTLNSALQFTSPA
jgi:RNA polymerase sigma-70 factor, ECF subfamily